MKRKGECQVGLVRKVGILKYTAGFGDYELRIRTREGTYGWKLDGDEFINGWYRTELDDRGRSRKMRGNGYINSWQQRNGKPIPPFVAEAIRGWMIMPSTLYRVGLRKGNGVEWLQQRKGKDGRGR